MDRPDAIRPASESTLRHRWSARRQVGDARRVMAAMAALVLWPTSDGHLHAARQTPASGVAAPADAGAVAERPAAPWDTALALPTAVDLNADPHILEVDLAAEVARVEVAPGRRVDAWTYNGTLPGPLLRLAVGDRLIVHFTNKLPMPTTVHWHGVRVPIQMDGVPGASQPAVETSGTFTYDFVVPDAGLYWYHQHVMSAAQVGFGLYGALLVDDPAEGFTVPEEHVLVLSDIDVTSAGGLEDPETGGSTGMAFGREGNTLLVNGRNHPRVMLPSGVTQRWRVVNTAKSRYFELDPGEGSTFTKIGGDAGLQEYPQVLEYLVLAPGERADVFYTPTAAPGMRFPIGARLFNRGYGSVEARHNEDLFDIVMAPTPPPPTPVPLPKTGRAIEPLSTAGATPVALEFGIMQTPVEKAFIYTINGRPLAAIPPLKAAVGETQIWTVTNTTVWSHPLHLHGFFFQVLDKDGQPTRPLQWKDTVSVPFKDSLKLVVRFDDRPGSWMYHCHILDHAEGGLMSAVQLSRPGEAPPPLPSEHAHTTPPK
jgi:FtsP/CotA-like multicopper oxidase with cupredoxin domain